MSLHSSLVGGSTAERRLRCPGSYMMEQTAGALPDVAGDAAREGSALHALMADLLARRTEPPADDDRGWTYRWADPRSGESFTVDHNLWLQKGKPALEAAEFLIGPDTSGPRPELFIERRVRWPDHPEAFGTVDLAFRVNRSLFILDFKFGSREVRAEENPQLMFYAVSLLHTHPEIVGDVRLEDIYLGIVQPEFEESLIMWNAHPQKLAQFRADLNRALHEARLPGARIEPGSWCRFAKCRVVCPHHIDAAEELLSVMKDWQAKGVRDAREEWAGRLGELLDLVELVEPFCATVRSAANAWAQSGNPIAGWHLAPGRRKPAAWSDEKAALRWLRKAFGGGRGVLDRIAPRRLMSPTQAAQALGSPIGDDWPVSRGETYAPRLVRGEGGDTEVLLDVKGA